MFFRQTWRGKRCAPSPPEMFADRFDSPFMFYRRHQATSQRRCAGALTVLAVVAVLALLLCTIEAGAVALGNFTINHFTRIEVGADHVRLRAVVDIAEIPTFQELQTINSNGVPSKEELNAYLEREAAKYGDGLVLRVDDVRVPLRIVDKSIALPQGAGGLQTLRIVCDYEAALKASDVGGEHHMRFEDTNNAGRIGWHELVVLPAPGVAVFNSNAFGNGVTDELKAYPQDMLAAPLNERTAELSFRQGGVPAGASRLRTRDGRAVEQSRDRLAELINVPEITPLTALLGLLFALALGAFHALSPGHGKTIVGAYLVGSRGTAKHAAFLGLTVTVTHTLGVFALGLITLFASQYIVPERLFPILSFVSGAIVMAIGFSLFVSRLRGVLSDKTIGQSNQSTAANLQANESLRAVESSDLLQHDTLDETLVDYTHGHAEQQSTEAFMHSHGGGIAHRHLPPGADGGRVTWRSLLALGISGGLLPCPSALVVLLSAIALHRVGYGMVLVVAFSIGLAGTLTAIGLAFVYAGRWMKRPTSIAGNRIVRVLPVVSAFIIACVGAGICYEALNQAGYTVPSLSAALSFK